MPSSTPARTPPRWNGLSPEERQRERRRLLIEAAFDLLGTEGTAGTTVRAVCAHARLNPRYFYESFDDLDALLVAVYDDVVDQLRREVAAAAGAAERDQGAGIRAAVEATVEFVDADRRRGRILYVEALGSEALNVRRLQTGFGLVEAIERDAARRASLPPGGTAIGRVGAAVLVGGFGEILAAWLDGRIELSRAQLIEDTATLFLSVTESAGDIVRQRHAAP